MKLIIYYNLKLPPNKARNTTNTKNTKPTKIASKKLNPLSQKNTKNNKDIKIIPTHIGFAFITQQPFYTMIYNKRLLTKLG